MLELIRGLCNIAKHDFREFNLNAAILVEIQRPSAPGQDM